MKMDALNSNLDCNETIYQFGVECTSSWLGMNVNTHTLTTTTTGSKNSQKGVNSQVDYQNHNALGPKGLFFTGLRIQLKSIAR